MAAMTDAEFSSAWRIVECLAMLVGKVARKKEAHFDI